MKLFKNVVQGALLISVVMASTAYARSAVPIEDHDKIPVVASVNKDISAEQVRQAIIVGGARRAWTFADSGAGQLTGTLVVRNKHTVNVTVDYNSKSYSIRYKDSSNMQYVMENGVPVIHPFYNKWIDNLIADVNVELAKFQ
jgi:hypothetical protein